MKKVFKSAAFLVATAGLIFNISCKKQLDNPINNSVALSEQEVSTSEQKVVGFLKNYTAVKNGAKIDGEAVTPENARWYFETTLNYCYGFTQDLLTNSRMDTVYVTLPETDAQGNISYNDLMDTYGSIIETVRDTYMTINMENKTLQFVMMNLDNNSARNEGSRVQVIMNTGSKDIDPGTPTPNPNPGPWYGIPFSLGDDWIWGLNRGKCDGSVLTSDAAQQLTEKVLNYDIANMLYYNPCPTCYTFIENPHTVYLFTGFHGTNDSIFHATGLTWEEVENYCIPYRDMNKYYAWIMQQSHYPGMIINPYGRDWYYKVQVEDSRCIDDRNGINNLWRIWHEITVINATRWWRKLDPSYPVPIDEIIHY